MNLREELEALIVKWRQPWSQDREKEEMRLICAEDLETILAKPETALMDAMKDVDCGEVMWAAQYANSRIEDALADLIGEDKFDKIAFDAYDTSIEVMVAADAVVERDSFMAVMNRFGTPFGWLNFSDGTEIEFNSTYWGDRKQVSHPRWTEERRANFLSQ